MTHSIQVENTSEVGIDFLTIAFAEDILNDEDSKTQSIEEVYEKDVFSYSLRSFWLEKVFSDEKVWLEPNYNFFADSSPIAPAKIERVMLSLQPKEKVTVQIGIFGKKDCTTGSLILEYGCRSPGAEQDPFFYTRQLRISFDLTVQGLLQAKNIDFVNYQHDLATDRSKPSRGFSDEELLFDPIMGDEENDPGADLKSEECFLTFDIQNIGSLSFEILWEIFQGIY